MNYHDLKVIHICSVIMFLLSTTITLHFSTKKLHKVISALMSIIVIASGLMLLRRFGISTTGPYPTWVIIKISCWLTLVIISPVAVKRFPLKAKYLFWPWALISFLATFMAIYKPL